MMKTLLCLLLALFTITAHGQLKKVTVKAVHDGQVLTVFADEIGEEMTMVIAGMTCPGLDQPYGKEAKEFMSKALLGKTVRVDPLDAGEDGIVALIWDTKGNRMTDELLKRGLATADNREPELVVLENEAKKKKLGIWKDGKPVDLEKDWPEHHMKDIKKR
jgi:micrococcal nuclease